jgi:hypothetical protein
VTEVRRNRNLRSYCALRQAFEIVNNYVLTARREPPDSTAAVELGTGVADLGARRYRRRSSMAPPSDLFDAFELAAVAKPGGRDTP